MIDGILVVMYHYIRDTEATAYPHIKALSVVDFKRQLDWLQSRFTVLDHRSFERVLWGDEACDGGPLALLTFDDGFVDHYDTVFPILRDRGLSGVFFVNDAVLDETRRLHNVHRTHFLLAKLGPEGFTEEVHTELQAMSAQVTTEGMRPDQGLYRYDQLDEARVKKLLNYELPFAMADSLLERLFTRHIGEADQFAAQLYLNRAMVAEMSAGGMTFGGHTARHRVLSRLDRAGQRGELEQGVDLIRAATGQKRVPFCYPHGHVSTYDDTTLELLASLEYSCAFNTVRRPARVNGETPFEIPRFDTKDLWPFTDLDPLEPQS